MPDSDKHLISNSSALSKPITPVSSPRQNCSSHSWSAQQLTLLAAAGREEPEAAQSRGPHTAPGLWAANPAILPLPTLAGQSSEENGLDRITAWDNIALFISTLHACCENYC